VTEPTYPTYPISKVAEILERSVYWLRWKEAKMIGEGTFVRKDGTPLRIARSSSPSGTVGPHSRRRYTIRDMEDMLALFSDSGVYHREQTVKRIANRIDLYRRIGQVH
jgi:hypothetical protein